MSAKNGRFPAADVARPVLVTGGAGFVGCNLADALASEGRRVIVFDNLSRAGVRSNLEWLVDRHGDVVSVRVADLRDESAVGEAVQGVSAVFHLAAQVAVTDSLLHPRDDFEINALGTLNLLEALRSLAAPVPLVLASTNKVYGDLADLAVERTADGHLPSDPQVRRYGVSEARPICLSTPYGCSKGAADQYVLDYARHFALPAAVLRMSCVYGPRQFGTEDQGWVAHFARRALQGEPVTLFGDGLQVRDILHVRDAVAAYRFVASNIRALRGRAFNLGGGTDNAVSLTAVLTAIERLTGRRVATYHERARAGDQLYFVADTRALSRATGWRATTHWSEGLSELLAWLRDERLAERTRPAPNAWSLTA